MTVFDTTTTATTAQYTHILTVTGRLGGLYTCTVANDKPSEDSAQLNVQGVLTVIAVCRSLCKTFLVTVLNMFQ